MDKDEKEEKDKIREKVSELIEELKEIGVRTE